MKGCNGVILKKLPVYGELRAACVEHVKHGGREYHRLLAEPLVAKLLDLEGTPVYIEIPLGARA